MIRLSFELLVSMNQKIKYNFFQHDEKKLLKSLGKEFLIEALKKMLLIRNFETRAEAAYLQGKVGGFFHAYTGQEAIQVACVQAFGLDNWYATSYRCHALALLLGATPNELMAELYGRKEGNAQGRGGSMHFYTERLLGGSGIVGGQLPLATGAAFSAKYKNTGECSLCFLGDGAVVQGAFSESLNLASLWDLPCIYVVENNKWGMGTAVSRAVCVEPIAENKAKAYNMKSYTIDGTDYFNCYAGFKAIFDEVKKEGRPVLVEAMTERFKGHSISDPANYRSKEDLDTIKADCSIGKLRDTLVNAKIIDEDTFKKMDKEAKAIAVDAMNYADTCSWPLPETLGEGVFAEESEEL